MANPAKVSAEEEEWSSTTAATSEQQGMKAAAACDPGQPGSRKRLIIVAVIVAIALVAIILLISFIVGAISSGQTGAAPWADGSAQGLQDPSLTAQMSSNNHSQPLPFFVIGIMVLGASVGLVVLSIWIFSPAAYSTAWRRTGMFPPSSQPNTNRS